MAEQKVDVFISGAGPVGLILTYQLARLGISTMIIDAADKASPDFPRTVEMLDQLDLLDEMAQQAFIGRRSITLRDGKKVMGRGWTTMENIQGTFHDFCLNLRLKYSEDIFRKRVENLGRKVQAPVKLVGLSVNETAADDYKVTATCATPDGRSFEVKSKYIVGCDGAGSAVRTLAEIPFVGAERADKWVRIDGKVKTNMPDSRFGYGAIETKTHGNVLWVALDHGATRIGFVLSEEMNAKYGRNMSQEDAIFEAKAALAPFELEFEQVDWHTVYIVKQFVAERFQDRERILLAGDAAHAHSSATAQGMNTGVHDVCSLAWRLAGVINGIYNPEVLANYNDERRAKAQHLIENDKVVAALISRHRPERYKDRTEDLDVLFSEFLREEGPFTTGLGMSYDASLLNDVDGSYPPLCVRPGQIAPDVLLHKQGFLHRLPIRLHEVTKYNGKFHIVVFSGEVNYTGQLLKGLRRQVDQDASRFEHAIEFRTIVYGSGLAFEEHMGVEQFGMAYWDPTREAHDYYRVSYETGAIMVLRPDGILGLIAPLDRFDKVVEYLDGLVVRQAQKIVTNGVSPIGKMLVPDENNLYYKKANAEDVPLSHEEGAVDSR